MVEHVGREAHGRVGDPVQRLRALPHLGRVGHGLVDGRQLVGRAQDDPGSQHVHEPILPQPGSGAKPIEYRCRLPKILS